MSELSQPHDPFAERAVVGALLSGEHVDLDPETIWDPQLREVTRTCLDLAERGQTVDPLTVRAELLRRGQRGTCTDGVWLIELLEARMPGTSAHVRTLTDLALRRRVLLEATRAQQHVWNPETDPTDLAASLALACTVLADGAPSSARSRAVPLHEFLAGATDYDWLVPGLLERGDRVLLTGGEGSGKSVCTRQMAVAAAAGVHPFSGERHTPIRVLLIDLENGERTLRRHLQALAAHAHRIGRPVPDDGLFVESLPAGTDLTRPDGEAWLTGLCAEHQPQLLVIGPLYRMHAADMTKEEPARHLTRVVDALRARHGCAVLMETHAPHAEAGRAQRNLRPIGSTLFMRWPEFGYGITPDGDDDESWRLVAWRGARDERSWPKRLRRGGNGEWPWMPADDSRSAVHRYWAEVQSS